MNSFAYKRATSAEQAVEEVSHQNAKFLAGGTNLIDLMKLNVQSPEKLVDINRLAALKQIETISNSNGSNGLRIGAMVSNSAVASHPKIEKEFPVLSEAILAGASPQLRNMATVGGNLLQRTRCYYFMDTAFPCNKRVPGSGCPAIPGFNRIHAILGASDQCIAVHPSDMCVALMALDAVIRVAGPKNERQIAMTDFHRLAGTTPQIDTNLQPDELIIAVDLLNSPLAQNSRYLKIRDRAEYAFALVSVAAALQIKKGKIEAARIALGGVAHKPWRALEAEQQLVGASVNRKSFQNAAEAALKEAQPQKHNAFKVDLTKQAIIRILEDIAHI